MSKTIYKCAVDGNLGGGRVPGMSRPVFAMCPHIGVGEPGRCRAHGNKKCAHKRRPDYEADGETT